MGEKAKFIKLVSHGARGLHAVCFIRATVKLVYNVLALKFYIEITKS